MKRQARPRLTIKVLRGLDTIRGHAIAIDQDRYWRGRQRGDVWAAITWIHRMCERENARDEKQEEKS